MGSKAFWVALCCCIFVCCAVADRKLTKRSCNKCIKAEETSFDDNVETRKLKSKESFLEDSKAASVRQTSEMHDHGSYSTVCWVEITRIEELRNGSKGVTREYAITFETDSDIPEKNVVVANNFEDVVPYKIYDQDTKKSEVVNFTTTHKTDTETIREHKKFQCGSGPIYIKEYSKWLNSKKKKFKIRVSPKEHNKLIVEKCEDDSGQQRPKNYENNHPTTRASFSDLPKEVKKANAKSDGTDDIFQKYYVILKKRPESNEKSDQPEVFEALNRNDLQNEEKKSGSVTLLPSTTNSALTSVVVRLGTPINQTTKREENSEDVSKSVTTETDSFSSTTEESTVTNTETTVKDVTDSPKTVVTVKRSENSVLRIDNENTTEATTSTSLETVTDQSTQESLGSTDQSTQESSGSTDLSTQDSLDRSTEALLSSISTPESKSDMTSKASSMATTSPSIISPSTTPLSLVLTSKFTPSGKSIELSSATASYDNHIVKAEQNKSKTVKKIVLRVRISADHIEESENNGHSFRNVTPLIGVEKQFEFNPDFRQAGSSIFNQHMKYNWKKFVDELINKFFAASSVGKKSKKKCKHYESNNFDKNDNDQILDSVIIDYEEPSEPLPLVEYVNNPQSDKWNYYGNEQPKPLFPYQEINNNLKPTPEPSLMPSWLSSLISFLRPSSQSNGNNFNREGFDTYPSENYLGPTYRFAEKNHRLTMSNKQNSKPKISSLNEKMVSRLLQRLLAGKRMVKETSSSKPAVRFDDDNFDFQSIYEIIKKDIARNRIPSSKSDSGSDDPNFSDSAENDPQ